MWSLSCSLFVFLVLSFFGGSCSKANITGQNAGKSLLIDKRNDIIHLRNRQAAHFNKQREDVQLSSSHLIASCTHRGTALRSIALISSVPAEIPPPPPSCACSHKGLLHFPAHTSCHHRGRFQLRGRERRRRTVRALKGGSFDGWWRGGESAVDVRRPLSHRMLYFRLEKGLDERFKRGALMVY